MMNTCVQAPMRTLSHTVLEEERGWDQAVRQIAGEGAELISVSRYTGDSRVYRRGQQIIKIRSLHSVLAPGVGRLDQEALVCSRLVEGTEYVRLDPWEVLILPAVEGVPLDALLPRLSLGQRIRVLQRLAPELERLHSRGVAHRDLRLDNVLVAGDGRPRLVDFDRASVEGRWAAEVVDWLGFAPSGRSASAFWRLALFTLAPWTQPLARRIRAHLPASRLPATNLPASAESDLQLLAGAWSLAQQSSTDLGGQQLARYAFTYRGTHFVGRHAWYLRWEAMRQAVGFAGKRVVDLSTDVGLLPCFAMIHGAEQAIGVEQDAALAGAARLLAQALGVSVTWDCTNLETDSGWESRLAGADLVVAMGSQSSLPTRSRLLPFLSTIPETIYESQDAVESESQRLRSAGFTRIRRLLETEPGRFLLYGTR